MNRRPLSFCDRVLGFRPVGAEFELIEARPSPPSGDSAGVFRADGVELQFVAYTAADGALSVWLSRPDAEALAANLQSVIDELALRAKVID